MSATLRVRSLKLSSVVFEESTVSSETYEMVGDNWRESVAVKEPSMSTSIDVHGDPMGAGKFVAICINDNGNWFRQHLWDTIGWIHSNCMILYPAKTMKNL